MSQVKQGKEARIKVLALTRNGEQLQITRRNKSGGNESELVRVLEFVTPRRLVRFISSSRYLLMECVGEWIEGETK